MLTAEKSGTGSVERYSTRMPWVAPLMRLLVTTQLGGVVPDRTMPRMTSRRAGRIAVLSQPAMSVLLVITRLTIALLESDTMPLENLATMIVNKMLGPVAASRAHKQQCISVGVHTSTVCICYPTSHCLPCKSRVVRTKASWKHCQRFTRAY